MKSDLELSKLPLDVSVLDSAARGFSALTIPTSSIPTIVFLLSGRFELVILSAFLSVSVPLLSKEALLSYPRIVASKRAAMVARSSTDEMNLMIMSLRHEASLPKAMAAAARRGSEFAAELRDCIWSVITGVHSTFEDSLHQLAVKWSAHCEELKPAIRATITASFEGTEAGRRRSLDRANEALVTGVKRRIEEYALALSVPSMILFGIGILLPLMVGSFLPMLSWDMWGVDVKDGVPEGVRPNDIVLQTIALMNVAFPAIALLVALDAVSKHPMPRQSTVRQASWDALRSAKGLSLAFGFSAAGIAVSFTALEGSAEYVSGVLCASVPTALFLMIRGSRPIDLDDWERRELMEDLLFGAGARMVDGENLEAALHSASVGQPSSGLPHRTLWDTEASKPSERDESNEERALGVVIEAASKNEAQAGILAMDLAGYLRDVAELEAVLKRRIKPTLSMMRMTTHVLAPIMLGVTHAIYVSLASIGGGRSTLAPDELFIVLAAFLMEINAVVAYFAWGIGEQRRIGALMYSIGSCILVAVLIMSAVTLVTS
ncbi:MAG: hypothetical protein JSV94_00770 [Methanobacteriota archaeon]|nr:MAG: hypothetical protein JSV94_00770 [Euryarchaeota archaeon]